MLPGGKGSGQGGRPAKQGGGLAAGGAGIAVRAGGPIPSTETNRCPRARPGRQARTKAPTRRRRSSRMFAPPETDRRSAATDLLREADRDLEAVRQLEAGGTGREERPLEIEEGADQRRRAGRNGQ